MGPTQIYNIFQQYYPDIKDRVIKYQEDKQNTSRINLIFNDGRKGTFEIKRGKYVLELEAKEE